jgi:hypothetical protein
MHLCILILRLTECQPRNTRQLHSALIRLSPYKKRLLVWLLFNVNGTKQPVLPSCNGNKKKLITPWLSNLSKKLMRMLRSNVNKMRLLDC